MATSRKAYVLEASTTGTNTAKKQLFFFFFFDFRKIARSSKHNKKIIVDGKKTSDQTHILECLKEFYEILSKKREQKTVTEVKSFLSHIKISKLSEDKAKPF